MSVKEEEEDVGSPVAAPDDIDESLQELVRAEEVLLRVPPRVPA